jgi:hypothetical protein
MLSECAVTFLVVFCCILYMLTVCEQTERSNDVFNEKIIKMICSYFLLDAKK